MQYVSCSRHKCQSYLTYINSFALQMGKGTFVQIQCLTKPTPQTTFVDVL